ncbi:hypothetical protein LINPERPRIM_LOCUS2647 [Linum perenne]
MGRPRDSRPTYDVSLDRFTRGGACSYEEYEFSYRIGEVQLCGYEKYELLLQFIIQYYFFLNAMDSFLEVFNGSAARLRDRLLELRKSRQDQ